MCAFPCLCSYVFKKNQQLKLSKQNIATSLAILFHVSGLLGILCTPYKDWFIQNTPLNLCLMTVLLVWVQPAKGFSFFLFFLIAFAIGIGTEIIGVNTERLFGSYQYGNILGPKFKAVPWLIGLNWFVVVFCSACVMQEIHEWTKRKMQNTGTEMPKTVATLSLILDGALLATFFDWIMEPVAMKLGFWQWKNGEIPFYNYTCWFAISLLLLLLLQRMRFHKANHFAVHLFIIQLLFFMALRTFL
jgi:putative membrane protein